MSTERNFELLNARLMRIESLLEQILEKLNVEAEKPKIPVLSFIDGPRRGEHIHLSDIDEFRIGRLHENNPAELDLALEDATITAEHCLIRRNDDDEFIIEDLGSRNGTFVNDNRLTETHTLKEGDCIGVGHTKFRFDRVQVISSSFPQTQVKSERDA